MPALLATYFMMFTNYLQHVDCDPHSPDNHSRNFTSPAWNWFVFDNGLHTVHHDHPGVHWSRYRALHEARAARIAPHLNQNSLLGYVIDTYVLRRGGTTQCGGADGQPGAQPTGRVLSVDVSAVRSAALRLLRRSRADPRSRCEPTEMVFISGANACDLEGHFPSPTRDPR